MTILIVPLTACGNKGKLKSPSQIAVQQAKKDAKEKKKQEENAAKDESESPAGDAK